MNRKALIITLLVLLANCAFAQVPPKKIWVSGYARSTLFMDKLTGGDSINSPNAHYGHTLIDLSANIRPNSQTFIRSTVRIRNEYGGFWGSGITFDLRELYVKGLIANAIRFQLGDINYKLTPFTLHNNDEEMFSNALNINQMYWDMLHYDLFYNDNNTWRQQGAAADFTLTFKKLAEEMQFNLFASRVHPTNFANIEERIFAGANATLVQSRFLSAGINYINMFDIEGTSTDSLYFRNPVVTGTYQLNYATGPWQFGLKGESGTSKALIKNGEDLPETEDFFNYAELKAEYQPLNMALKVAYRDVGPDFRSPGAQMRRLSYGVNPDAYKRYTDNEILRPVGMWDFMNEEVMYNTQISNKLLDFYPQYDNIEPYGLATPNRKGLDITLCRSNAADGHTFSLQYQTLSEVVGQGTEELRNFQAISFDGELNVSAFLNSFDRKIAVQVGFRQASTDRSSDIEFEQVDLSSQRISAGVSVEVVKNLELLAGYQTYTAEGNEEIAERNDYNEVDYFHSFSTNLKEDMLGFGLRYNFSENSTLQAIWQTYSWSDEELTEHPDYGFDRIAVVYRMKF